MNPVLPIEKLILFSALLLPAAVWAAWKSAAALPPRLRLGAAALRAVGVALVLLAAFNPGCFISRTANTESTWALLVDSSASMLQKDADSQRRLDRAAALARRTLKKSGRPEAVRTAAFSDNLHEVTDGFRKPSVIKGSTDIIGSAAGLLNEYAGTGLLRGILLLSDGRQVAQADPDTLTLAARAQNCPVYAVALGGPVPALDISVHSPRREYVTFKGQPVNINIKVAANLDTPQVARVQLLDSDGKALAERKIELPAGKATRRLEFTIPQLPPGRHLLTCRTAALPNEQTVWNNRDSFDVAVLDQPVNILHLEGLPYWDSKFLMQLLRKQPNMRTESIYRVGRDRFFKVTSNLDKSTLLTGRVFPAKLEDLCRYDMLIIGKGAEYMLTPANIPLIRAFVRDHGGALVFARSKPYHGTFPALATLEPGVWGGSLDEDIKFAPAPDGTDTGLFGRLLPGSDAPVWSTLPPIGTAHRLLRLRPFTKVLAFGILGREKIPLIVSRRYGKGMILSVNADGLWHWSFMPSNKQAAGMYNEIWAQLLNWTVTYGEFLPGEDISASLTETTLPPGGSTRLLVRHRPVSRPVAIPTVKLTRDGQPAGSATLTKAPGSDLSWQGILAFNTPGLYRVTIASPDARPITRVVTVIPPPDELSNQSTDPAFLTKICRATGGSVIRPADIPELVATFEKPAAITNEQAAEWNPAWDNPLYLILVLIPFALEWFIRRRNGLL